MIAGPRQLMYRAGQQVYKFLWGLPPGQEALRRRFLEDPGALQTLFRDAETYRKYMDVQAEYAGGSLRFESTPEQTARQIATDRSGYPVLLMPMQTGGETEQAEVERHLADLGVPYQVVPITRERERGIIYPHGYALAERIDRLRYDNGRVDKALVVVGDDISSSGLDLMMAFDELDDQMARRSSIHDVKIAVYLADRVGLADPGYALFRTSRPVFTDKYEALEAYRRVRSANGFLDMMKERRQLFLPRDNRSLHTFATADETYITSTEEDAYADKPMAAAGAA